MKLRILSALFSFSLLSSCYTASNLSTHLDRPALQFDASSFTGLYENQIPEDSENSLWNDLCLHHQAKKTAPNKGDQVFLEYLNKKEIKATLFYKGKFIDEMILPGKRKEQFFSVRKGSHFFSLLFISSIKSQKTILGNDINGDLMLAQGNSNNVMLLDDTEALDEDGEIVVATYMRLGDRKP